MEYIELDIKKACIPMKIQLMQDSYDQMQPSKFITCELLPMNTNRRYSKINFNIVSELCKFIEVPSSCPTLLLLTKLITQFFIYTLGIIWTR